MAGFQNFTKRLFSIVSARLLTLVITFVTTPIVVRLLGPAGWGNYAVLLSVFTFWMLPVSSAVTEGVQKFVGEEHDDQDEWHAGVVQFYLGFGGVLVTISVLALVTFTALGGAAWLFGDEFTLYFYVLAAYVFLSQFRAIGYHTVLGFGKEQSAAALSVGKKAITMIVGISLVVTASLGVTGMLVGHVVANLLIALTAGYLILRTIPSDAVLRPSFKSVPYRKLVSFNLLNIVLIVLVRSLAHVDIVMLRIFADPSSTGFYKAALSTAEYIWIVPMGLQTVLLHSSSSLWSDDAHDQITDIATRITRYTVLLVVVMAIGMAVLVDRFMPLYFGSEYVASIVPLLVLLPGVVGFAAARPLQAISQGSGQLRTLVVAVFGAAGLNFGLNAALIPRFGMMGAAAATSVGYGSMFAFLVWAAYRLGFDPLADFRAGRIALTAGLSAPVIWGMDYLIGNDFVALVVVPPIGFVTYTFLALNLGALDVSEVQPIVERAPGPVAVPILTALSWVE